MAGDWIKMRMDLQSHPKIVRILSATKSDKFRAIGGLHAVWSVFDQHSENGELHGYTPELMDHVIGWSGFSDAMIAVGWLLFDGDETLAMPDFGEHNGKSAKRRAEDQKRKRDERKSPQSVRDLSAEESDKDRTREEKRREEKEKPIKDTPKFDPVAHLTGKGVPERIARDWLALRKTKKLAPTETAFAGVEKEAAKAGMSLADAIEKCCSRGWGGFDAKWLTEPIATRGAQKKDERYFFDTPEYREAMSRDAQKYGAHITQEELDRANEEFSTCKASTS